MNFREIEKAVNFELTNTFTWGVKNDKYGGYSIPITLDDETIEKIEGLVQEYGTRSPLYKRTIYLKSKSLSEKQMSELHNKGRTPIEVHFVVKGVYTKGDDINHLVFKIRRLRKIERPESDDSCPED